MNRYFALGICCVLASPKCMIGKLAGPCSKSDLPLYLPESSARPGLPGDHFAMHCLQYACLQSKHAKSTARPCLLSAYVLQMTGGSPSCCSTRLAAPRHHAAS